MSEGDNLQKKEPREKKPAKKTPPLNNQFLPEDSEDLERVAFLKDYSRDITRTPDQVASSLKIPQNKAERYLKDYMYNMILTAGDNNHPKRVRMVLNENLGDRMPEILISDMELLALRPLIERYGDVEVLNSFRNEEKKRHTDATLNLMNKKVSNAFGFTTPMSPNSPSFNPGSSTGTQPNTDSPNSDFDFSQPREQGQSKRPLSPSGRVNLMRYVLEHVPHIHYTKIDPFLDLFEAGEMKYMSSPDELYLLMTRYYGPHIGQLAFQQFKDLITSHLKPSEQFGANPYWGGGTSGTGGMGGGGMGGGWYGPSNGGQNNYYEALGILPAGVNPNSPEARQAIFEWRNEQKRKKAAEEMQENIKNYVNLKMMDIVDPKRGGGGPMGMGGGGDQWMAPLLMSGAVRAVPKVGPQGEAMIAYENTGMQGQNQENSMLGMMRIMMEMYNAILAQQANTPRFMESILTTMLNKFSTQTDPFELAISAKKLSDAFTPTGGGIQQSIEAAKLLLAQKKMDTDRDLTLQKMNFEHENELYERKKHDEQEAQSSQQTNEIVKNIFSIGSQALVPLLSMFMGRGAPGGLASMLGAMQGGQPPGGMPPGMEGMMPGMGGGNGGMPGMGGMGMGMPGMPGGGNGGMGPPPGFAGMGPMMEPPSMGPTMMPGSMPVDMNQIIQGQQDNRAPNFNPDWAPPPSDLFGYGAGPTQPVYTPPPPPSTQERWANFQVNPQSQVQAQTEEMIAPITEIPEKTSYTPQDFENLSEEELEAYSSQGETSRSSIDSFNNALRIARQRRRYAPTIQQTTGGQQEMNLEIPTQETQVFSNMPSNVPLTRDEAAVDQINMGRQPVVGSVFDDMVEPVVSANNKDLRPLPDTPTAEEKNKDEVVSDSDIG